MAKDILGWISKVLFEITNKISYPLVFWVDLLDPNQSWKNLGFRLVIQITCRIGCQEQRPLVVI